jgi:hypothetical protein
MTRRQTYETVQVRLPYELWALLDDQGRTRGTDAEGMIHRVLAMYVGQIKAEAQRLGWIDDIGRSVIKPKRGRR